MENKKVDRCLVPFVFLCLNSSSSTYMFTDFPWVLCVLHKTYVDGGTLNKIDLFASHSSVCVGLDWQIMALGDRGSQFSLLHATCRVRASRTDISGMPWPGYIRDAVTRIYLRCRDPDISEVPWPGYIRDSRYPDISGVTVIWIYSG